MEKPDKFISHLTRAFAVLAENREEKSESTKVRKLLPAITNPTLNLAKAIVQAGCLDHHCTL
jgi:hypothetical protein